MKLEHSLIYQDSSREGNGPPREDLISDEVRWHYSQHFMAESKGEEVIEDILRLTRSKRQRALLGAQLRDEKEHQFLFQNIVDQIGFDQRASGYAHGYSKLVLDQETLSEKVYVFQIMTEAASAAYCDWRLKAILNPELNRVDAIVKLDEERHLIMGGSMLSMCEPDELTGSLSSGRRMELIRKMNELCRSEGQKAMYEALLPQSRAESRPKTSELDKSVSRMIISEVRKIENFMASVHIKELPSD